MSLGYGLVLPRPWTRIDLAGDVPGQVAAILDATQERIRTSTDAPPDQVAQVRRQIEGRLLSDLRRAKDKGGVDYYLPADVHPSGVQLNANFLVSTVIPDAMMTEEGVPQVMTQLIADGRKPVTIDDTIWLRSEKDVREGATAGDLPEVTLEHRRVEYVTALPGDPRTWVMVSYTAAGDGDLSGTPVRILVELFDAIMGTWRWSSDVIAASR